MKANELMVGDWVSVLAHFLETSTEGTATSGGYNLCRKNCHIGGMNGDLIAIDKICSDVIAYDPIPLTEEILKANGFCPKNEDLSRKVLQGDYGNKISIVFIVQNNRIHIYRNIHKILNLKIHYVHELQHALRLCGLADVADNLKIE